MGFGREQPDRKGEKPAAGLFVNRLRRCLFSNFVLETDRKQCNGKGKEIEKLPKGTLVAHSLQEGFGEYYFPGRRMLEGEWCK